MNGRTDREPYSIGLLLETTIGRPMTPRNFFVQIVCACLIIVPVFGVRTNLRHGRPISASRLPLDQRNSYTEQPYSSANHYNGAGHKNEFDASICKFAGGVSDANNIFKVGHNLAKRRRYADSKNCFQHALNSWWTAVRNGNPLILQSQNNRWSQSEVNGIQEGFSKMKLGKHKEEEKAGSGRPQVPPQLEWLKAEEQKEKVANANDNSDDDN